MRRIIVLKCCAQSESDSEISGLSKDGMKVMKLEHELRAAVKQKIRKGRQSQLVYDKGNEELICNEESQLSEVEMNYLFSN